MFSCGRLHYFSIYRNSGERIPSKFDQQDYKPPRTRSFKPHLCCLQGPQYITPSVQCIYQSPPLRCCRSPKDRRKMEEHADQNWGPNPAGSRECEAWPTELEWLFEWVLIHHAEVAVGRQSWPRWKPFVMIDGCMSASEPSESAQQAAEGHHLLLELKPQHKGNQWTLWIELTIPLA